MVVAVHGTDPARVAGVRVPRLLRGALVAVGLSALAWLLTALLGPTTAAAEPPPPVEANGSGLLGIVGGLTNTVGQLTGDVVTTATTAVGQLTGAVADAGNAVIPPVITAPAPVVTEPVDAVPVSRKTAPLATQAVKPVVSPVESRPAAEPVVQPTAPAAVSAHQHGAVRRPEPFTIKPVSQPSPDNQVNRSEPRRAPSKAPLAPAAPAVPTGSVSAGHDGPGNARGTLGVLPATAVLEPPAEAFTTRGRACEFGGRAAGLPAASPD